MLLQDLTKNKNKTHSILWLGNYQFNSICPSNNNCSIYRTISLLYTPNVIIYRSHKNKTKTQDRGENAPQVPTDAHLEIENIQRKNRLLLDKFLSCGCSKLENTIRRKINHNDDAEDIIQQTYMEAWRCKDRFEGNSKPETWMCGIACNIIKKYIKERRKHITENIDDINEILYNSDPCLEFYNPSDIVEQTQEFEKIRKQLEKMPKNMKEIIETRLDSDDNYYETAEKLNIAVGTVRSRLSRAREKLRDLQRINPV